MFAAHGGKLVMLALCAVFGLFLLLAAATARTAGVHGNEGLFADPAYRLIQRGCLCTTVIESSGFWLAGVDRHTYWILPFHPMVQSVWYRIFGFSLWTMRSLSIAAGALALGAWFVIVRRLFGARAALLAALLIAVDYRFVQASASGRMDMLCAALGTLAACVYVVMRERNLKAAVLAAHTLAAAACFTHPCGLLAFAGLLAIMWWLDRAELKVGLLALAAVPYLLAGMLYGIYILEAPHEFLSQFRGNISGFAGEAGAPTRSRTLVSPLRSLWEEWNMRYLPAFRGPFRLQFAILCLYVAGLFSPVIDRDSDSGRPARSLWMWAATATVLLWILDGSRHPEYLVHVVPAAAACLAIWLAHRVSRPGAAGAVGLLALVAIQVVTTQVAVRRNSFAHEYQPAIAFLKTHATPGGLVMGDAGLAFGLGFDSAFVDDFRLGYYSGKRPQFFVMTGFSRAWFERRRTDDPKLYGYIRDTLSRDYRNVFQNAVYTIYARRETGSGTATSGDGSLTNGVASK